MHCSFTFGKEMPGEGFPKREPPLVVHPTAHTGGELYSESLVSLNFDFVREAQFDWLGVFGYSDEEGAKAFDLESKVSPREIERRRKKLMSIQKQISRKKKKSLVGRQFELVLEGPSAETELLWEGRTVMHAPEIDGTVYVNDFGEREVQEGEFYRCEITEAHDYDLVARIL